jgi:plastocyanin
MRHRPLPLVARCTALAVLALVAAACHTGTSTVDLKAMATCSPTGTALRIEAQNLHFDRDCLAAPAAESFTLTLRNDENGIPHNVSIYPNGTQGDALFKGDAVTGVQTTVYRVQGLPAGTYYFQCDVHPDMNGALVVR